MKLIHAMAGFTAAALATSALALTYPDTQKVDIIGTYDGIGWTWTSDYGSTDNLEQFKALYAYSPLHTIKAGTKYPPTLVMTADRDDRVVSAHSFTYSAAMQAVNSGIEGSGPILIRVETRAGAPTQKIIQERADVLAFLMHALSFRPY